MLISHSSLFLSKQTLKLANLSSFLSFHLQLSAFGLVSNCHYLFVCHTWFDHRGGKMILEIKFTITSCDTKCIYFDDIFTFCKCLNFFDQSLRLFLLTY